MKKASNPYHMQEFKKVGSLEDKIKLFPFLENISSKKDLEEIVQVMDKLSNAEHAPNEKYNILWDVLKLGSLLERELPEKIKEGVTRKRLNPISSTSKTCMELTDSQQHVKKCCGNTGVDQKY